MHNETTDTRDAAVRAHESFRTFKSLYQRWKSRKSLKFKEMPTIALLVVLISIGLSALALGYLIKMVIVQYLDVAFKLPFWEWGWQSWYVTALLFFTGIVVWFAGLIVTRCNQIIRERWLE